MFNGRQISIRSRFISAFMAALLALFGVFGTAGPAHATGTGSISGTVVDASLAGIPDSWSVDVTLFDADGQYLQGTSVDPATGAYSFTDLDDGSYYLQFSGLNYSPSATSYLTDFYPGVGKLADATPVVISGGSAEVANEAMSNPSTLNINFFEKDGITPVRAYAFIYDTDGNQITMTAPADESGYLSISDLRPGTYYVCAGAQWGTADWAYDPTYSFMYNCLDKKTATGMFDSSYLDGAQQVIVGAGTTSIDYTVYRRPVVTGSVTDKSGNAINYVGGQFDGNSQIQITFWDANTDEWAGYATPNADGSFETRIDPGTYYVQFTDLTTWQTYVTDPSQANHYLSAYYNDGTEEKTAVTLGVNSTTNNIEVMLSNLTSISGTVVDAKDTSKGLAGVHVYLETKLGDFIQTVDTDADGNYKMWVEAGGSYKLHFDGGDLGYGSNYYGGDYLKTATVINVTAGDTLTGYDSMLKEAASISGTVYGWDGAQQLPLQDICIYVSGDFGSRSSCTDSLGHYSVGGLPDGTYTVWADTNGTDYLARYYGNTPYQELSTPVVISNQTSAGNIDLTLYHGAKITGKLLGEQLGGSPAALNGVYVGVSNDNFNYSAYTDVNGVYTIAGVEPGTDYLARAIAPRGSNFISSYYLNQSNPKAANLVTATMEQTTTLQDWTLSVGASVTGNIFAIMNSLPTGVPGGIFLNNITTGESFFVPHARDGSFTGVGLTAGDYALDFEPFEGSAYAPVFNYPIGTLTLGQVKSGVNIQLELGATISGTVTGASDSGSVPVPVGLVIATLVDDNRYWSTSTLTSQDGSYTLTGLPVGDFTLRFIDMDSNYSAEYWNNANSLETANTVTISSLSDAKTGINAELGLAGSISGRITFGGPFGTQGLSYADVAIYTPACDYVTSVSTDMDGYYQATGIAAGDYLVWANSFGDLNAQFYGGGIQCETATVVSVTSGQDTGGIDINLVAGGSISGTVTNEAGTPLANVEIQLYSNNLDYWNFTTTDADGFYSFTGIPQGSDFKVHFSGIGTYRGQFFKAADSWDAATPLEFAPGTSYSGIDATLVEGGSIHFRVVGDNPGSTPTVLTDSCLDVSDLNGNWVDGGCVDQNGEVTISGLADGDYTIGVFGSGRWISKVFGLQTPITVVKGQITELGDLVLDPGATIAGEIYGLNGQTKVPVSGYVSIVNNATQDDYGMWADTGSYVSQVLPAGTYHVTAYIYDGTAEFYYDGAGFDVTVAPAEAKTGVDLVLSKGASISGTVNGLTKAGIVHPGTLRVEAYLGTIDNMLLSKSVRVGVDGKYQILGLPVGTYSLMFSDDNGDFLTQVQDSVAEIKSTTDALTGFDANLEQAGKISGQVVDGKGNPVVWADIVVLDQAGHFVTMSNTDEQGNYVVGGLAAGTYYVSVTPYDGENLTTYYYQSSTQSGATSVEVVAGETTSAIDITVIKGGQIWGSVHPASDPSKSVAFEVALEDQFGNLLTWGMTDNKGNFAIGGIADGTYYVRAVATDAGYYPAYWHESEDTKTAITIVAGQVVDGIDILLNLGSSISGNISELRNGVVSPVSGISVVATDETGTQAGYAQADAQGNFVIKGLAPGKYVVEARPSWGFGEKGGTSDLLDATLPATGTFDLTTPTDIVDVNFTLLPGARITGKLTVPNGLNPAGLWIFAESTTDWYQRDGVIEPDGTYVIDGLPAGSYHVSVIDWEGRVVNTFYGDTDNVNEAITITVSGTETKSSVNINLIPAATITGVVTGLDNGVSKPLERVYVTAYDAAGKEYATAYTDAQGRYTIKGLPAGSYKLYADNLNWYVFNGAYSNEWFGGSADQAGATSVSITAGQVSAHNDIELSIDPKSVQLSGHITWAGGIQTGIVRVCAFSVADQAAVVDTYNPVSCAWMEGMTDSYHLLLPKGGNYKLYAESYDMFYGGTTSVVWYGGSADPANATMLTLTDGQVKTDAAIEMPNLDTFKNSARPKLDGDLKVGETIKIELGDWDAGTAFTYQWLLDGDVIDGATAATYTVKSTDRGHQLSVVVTGTKAGTLPVSLASYPGTVGFGDFTVTAKPTFSGTAKVGGLLTAVVSNWDDGVTVDLIWTRDGVDIQGATGTTYTLTADDLGHKISVRASGVKDGYNTTSEQSDGESTVEKGDQVKTPKPTFTGTVAVGQTLTATVGTWDDGVVTGYKWLRDGTPIEGATGLTYVVVSGDVGHKISVQVTGTKSAYNDATKVSDDATAAAGAQTKTPKPSVTGTATVGLKLTATVGTWDEGAVTSIKWYRDSSAIGGATGSEYTLVADDYGHSITVRVTGVKPGYADSTVSSDAISVAAADQTLTGTPSISGTAKVGQVLTGSAGTWDAGTTLSYRWLANGVAISNATATTYTLTSSELGKTITFEVKSTKTGYNNKTATTAATVAVVANITVSTAPKLSGTAKKGSTVKSTSGSYKGVSSPKYTYQWYRCTAATVASTSLSDTCTAISKATKSSYKVVAADKGRFLVAGITATGTSGSITSYTKSTVKTK